MWVGRGDRHQEVKKKYNMQKKNMDQNQGGRGVNLVIYRIRMCAIKQRRSEGWTGVRRVRMKGTADMMD